MLPDSTLIPRAFRFFALALAASLLLVPVPAVSPNAPADDPAVESLGIVPKPWKVELRAGRFELKPGTGLVVEDNWAEAAPVAAYLAGSPDWNGGPLRSAAPEAPASSPGGALRMTLKAGRPDLGEEGYILAISPAEVLISANAAAGLFYGVQTVRQLTRRESEGVWSLPCLHIEDKPRFPWRGMLLDCGRHFMSKDFVLRTIDLLAAHKMNRFHWHLTEDQGWRVEIKKFPRLTEFGAWRVDETGNRYGGFYTQEDIREVVAYARSRFVTVIPEIEMPGHAVAALASYPEHSCTGGPFEVQTMWGVHKDVYCAGSDATFAFLEDILSEVMELFPAPYVHIGGDEVPKDRWKACPRCQARMRAEGLKDENELQRYFIARVEKYLNSRGRRLIGWDEILEGGLAPDATVQSWRSFEGALAAARSGHDAIVSPVTHAYFDFDLRRTDLRQVYAFEPVPRGLSPEETRHILGGECNMWTEYAPQETIDRKLFPRLPAMAECLWTRPEEKDFQEFRRRLKIHLPRLASAGVKPGAEARPLSILALYHPGKGRLLAEVRSSEPGLAIRVTLDGSLPSPASTVYGGPLDIDRSCLMRAAAFLAGEPYGEVEERVFVRHRGRGGRVSLASPFSSRYPSAGQQALADGVRGSLDHRDGAWQGFEGRDLEVTVDLGRTQPLHRLRCGFLQHASIAIFMPVQVEFFVSSDGKDFRPAGTVWPRVPRKMSDRLLKDVTVEVDGVSARYVRLRAEGNGPCPAGHPLAGVKSWIFADEIIVE